MSLAGKTLAELARALARGETTSRRLTEAAHEAIEADPRAFTRRNPGRALDQADVADRARASGAAASPLAGVPVSVKDLFDIEGEPTPVGSAILADAPAAISDAPVVARLKAAGLVIIGATQMSEFAFTGLGLNPHAPQPPNPRDPTRAPGGSSGGAAVSVALGQAAGAIGTDTGGSVRIPAAFCGLVGFKPTQERVTRDGAFPLSRTLDSVGPIANSVACCAALDALIADAPRPPTVDKPLAALRLGVPDNYFTEDLEPQVANAFERSLSALSWAGAKIETFHFAELDLLPVMQANGSISNAEAFALHRRLGLLNHRERYDPNVLARVEFAENMTAADYLDLLAAREALILEAERRCQRFDAILAPTVPILAPRIEELSDPESFARLNRLALRNPAVVNFLDGCAVSLPMSSSDPVPSGMMVVGGRMADPRILGVARAVEGSLR